MKGECAPLQVFIFSVMIKATSPILFLPFDKLSTMSAPFAITQKGMKYVATPLRTFLTDKFTIQQHRNQRVMVAMEL